ncbi:alpha/beta hydrolase family protein [Candidatus Latescibacterota bacterium]
MRTFSEAPVVFSNQNMHIVGMLHRPAGIPHPPAVVFYHGCTTSRNEAHWIFVKIARALARSGIMALRFDFRHSGESEGEFSDMTISGEVDDGIRAVDYLVEDAGADPSRIGIVGMSMGGAIGAIVAGGLREKIRSCVLLNPVGKPGEDLGAIAKSNDIDVTRYPIEFNTFLFGEAFVHDIVTIQPLEAIRHATCPVLIINSTGDTSVNPRRSREYQQAIELNGGSVELFAVDGADHLFSTARWEKEVIDRVTAWFSKTLA